jgi:hypothetical protein
MSDKNSRSLMSYKNSSYLPQKRSFLRPTARTSSRGQKYNSNADIFYHLSFSRKNSKKNSKEKRANVTYLAADVITLTILGTDPRIFISGMDFSMSEWITAFFYDVNFLNYYTQRVYFTKQAVKY